MIELTNTFHNTTARIRAKEGENITRATERRVWRKLCGMADCTCSYHGGVRGGDFWLIATGHPWDIAPTYRVERQA
jgi:hypothetical protein